MKNTIRYSISSFRKYLLIEKKNQEESLFSITDGKELITCKSGVTSISLNLYSFSTNFKIGCRISQWDKKLYDFGTKIIPP